MSLSSITCAALDGQCVRPATETLAVDDGTTVLVCRAHTIDTRRALVAGRLDCTTFAGQESLSLSVAFAGRSESVLVYGPELELDVEILKLAEQLLATPSA